MKYLRILTTPFTMPQWWQDLIIALPRIICGFLLTSSFGSDKFGMPWSPVEKKLGFMEVIYWFTQDVEGYGGIFAQHPIFFAWMAGFSEAVGGLLLLIGLQTRIAGFLLCMTMLGAIFLQQINQGMWNCLPAMGFLWVSIYAMVLGSGRFGVDYLLSKKGFFKKEY
jgi:putative oxidoreductase